MRDKMSKLAFLGLALVVVAIRTSAGAGLEEAQGAKTKSWQVEIPKSGSNLNLVGFDEQANSNNAIFTGQGWKGSPRVQLVGDRIEHSFWLIIGPGTAEQGVTIQNVDLPNSTTLEEPSGRFPDRDGCSDDPMTCFLNGSHPYTNYDFSLQVVTQADPETMSVGSAVDGTMNIAMWDYWDESGDYHRLYCASDPDSVTIQRTGIDEWTVFGAAPLSCEEYYVTSEPSRPGKVKSVKHTVATADTTVFSFLTVWTRK